MSNSNIQTQNFYNNITDINVTNQNNISIYFNKVSYYYPGNKTSPAIGEVSFKINANEIIGIFGANGSGKSTIAKLAAGLLLPTSGEVLINGIPTSNILLVRRNIGYLFQDPDSQIIGLTVEEDLAFGLENYNIPSSEIQNIILNVSSKLNLNKFLKTPINQLSAGTKQKVAIASVIILSPSFLILDEPFAYLDPWTRKEILDILMSLQKNYNLSIIIISPKISFIDYIHKALIVFQGKIVFFDNVKELWKLKLDTLESWGLNTPDEIILQSFLDNKLFPENK